MTADIDTADRMNAIPKMPVHDAANHVEARLMNGQDFRRQNRRCAAILAQLKFIEPRAKRRDALAHPGGGCRHHATLSSHAPGQYVTCWAMSPLRDDWPGRGRRNSG